MRQTLRLSSTALTVQELRPSPQKTRKSCFRLADTHPYKTHMRNVSHTSGLCARLSASFTAYLLITRKGKEGVQRPQEARQILLMVSIGSIQSRMQENSRTPAGVAFCGTSDLALGFYRPASNWIWSNPTSFQVTILG
jgi:hypothetical protein